MAPKPIRVLLPRNTQPDHDVEEVGGSVLANVYNNKNFTALPVDQPMLQAALTEGAPAITRGSRVLRVGDKVMQVRNDYDKEVWNGDSGVIERIDAEAETVHVRFDDRTIEYELDETDALVLAYAATVHKSQGSEYAAVVVPVHTQHFVMLQRNLLYTAVTRGKRLVVLVGTRKALALAVRNADVAARCSGLAPRLRAR